MDVRITFDERDMTTTFVSTVESGETRVVVTYPDEIVRDLGRSLKLSTDWMLSIPARTDLFGKIMQGAYTVLVERYNVGGTVLQATETVTFDLSYEDLPVTVGESWDIFAPNFRLTDITVYDRPNFLTTAPLTRLWTAANGQHEWSLASLSFLTLYDGGYFTGKYEWSLETVVTSVMDNDYVTLITKEVVSGTKTINLPPMISELAQLFNCLYAKISADGCCKNASTERMLADYLRATAMWQHFITNGQAGTTDSAMQSLLLFGDGTACNPGILGILKYHGCYNPAIDSVLISAYDFCLCSDGGGGGGTTVAAREGYSAGNGAFIVSDAIDDDDRWTFAKSAGVGTFTQNLAGSRIFGGSIRGNLADAAYNSNGANTSFKLILPIPGELCNVDEDSALLAMVNCHSAHNNPPADNAPWVLDQGAVQVRVVGIGSGTVSYVFTNIGATLGDWVINFLIP